ncbi:hypothetical protein LAZ67_8000932 [Cordylochernes scorpioides]|uniref:Transposase n=1 Tax=Cordylochernes scorpioides TaxID=51811 RepID=A0ABY6KPS5_9ARAC|nr:hypothetical protein LAZ67_8000932 [Cordylochernes scorpioides]
MENFKWEIFTHSPYSPELAPSDFHLYPALKWHLGGKHLANDDEVQAEANHWLRRPDTAWYNSAFKLKLAPKSWLGWRIGELTGPPPNITIATRGALTDAAALGCFCSRLVTQKARGRDRIASLVDAIVVRGTTTLFQRLTIRTARRMLERPRLAELPIT